MLKKVIRKSVSLLLALVLLLSIAAAMPVRVAAANGYLSRLPFDKILYGDIKYSDCVGKPTVVIFGGVSCSKCTFATFFIDQFIEQKEIEVNVLFFDTYSSIAEIKNYFDSQNFNNVSAYRCVSNSLMWDILRGGGINNTFWYPAILYFDKMGNIVKTTTDSTNLDDISDNIAAAAGLKFPHRLTAPPIGR